MTRLYGFSWLVFLLAGVCRASDRTHVLRDLDKVYLAVEVSQSTLEDPCSTFQNHARGWTYEQPLESIPNHHLFSIPADLADTLQDFGPHLPQHLQKRSPLTDSGVISLEILHPRQLHKRSPIPLERAVDSSLDAAKELAHDLNIQDPLFPEQWHLYNPVQPGHDLNVTGLWLQNVTGAGVKVAVIDDGLDLDGDDLKDNFFPEGSWDFNDPGPLPKPRLSDDRHGTRCAGEIAAGRNNMCGVGVAYDSKVAGIRILSKRIMPADEALAINFAMQENDIYSCSWGPSDDGQTMEGPPEVVKKAMLNAIQNGRGGKGNLYVFAAGNGGNYQDNCNFDGYTNSIYSITVASIDRRGMHPGYSESCSGNMVVTYSSGSGDFIHTTDVNGKCTDRHGGTSAAAPIAAGIFALVLQVRPELTWRDLQYLSFDTAVPFALKDPGWQETVPGKQFHHMYGFGKLDAYSIVDRARTWELVKPQAWCHCAVKKTDTTIPSDGREVEFKTNVTAEQLSKANFGRLEHVNVLVNADAARRGELSMDLVSPSGVVSNVMPTRHMDNSPAGVRNWKFMSVVHWNEDAVGEWTLRVRNAEGGHGDARLIDWQLQLWGESVDSEKALVFPGPGKLVKPNGESDGNRDNWETEEGDGQTSSSTSSAAEPTSASSAASSISVSSTSSPEATSTTSPATSDVASATSATPAATETSETPDEEEEHAPEEDTDKGADESEEHHHSESMIPTFGMSGHTAAWVYGSALVIILFIGSVSAYLYIAHRRRSKDGSSSYAFNPLLNRHGHDDDEEGDELAYLNEFEVSDDESIDSDRYARGSLDDDLESAANAPSLAAGKKARDLYSTAPDASAVTLEESSSGSKEFGEKEKHQSDQESDPFKLHDSDDQDADLLDK